MHGMGKRAQALRVALGWGWPDHPGSRILGEWCYGGGGLGWWPLAQKTPPFWFFWGRQAVCALHPVRRAGMLVGSNFTTTLQRQHINFPPNLPFENLPQTYPQETNALSFDIDAVINLHHQTQQE